MDGVVRMVARGAVCAALLTLAAGCTQQRGDSPEVVTTKTGAEMVLVRGGWFEMGSSQEDELDQTPHRVYVDSFYMDRHPVTQEEYFQVMGKNPSRSKNERHPAEQIRWADAAAFCNARSELEGRQPAYDPQTWKCDFQADGYRLPTEAEWEYAARAGTTSVYFFGDNPAELPRYAWFSENSAGGPHPVGRKGPNPWGLYDMYGNVWQWCNDFYQEDYYQQSPQQNPRGPASGASRVVRGGCWDSRARMCSSAYRESQVPALPEECFRRDVHGFIGFRCVRRTEG
jgi:formylglycine-generating enzyme required for sulfatase activity